MFVLEACGWIAWIAALVWALDRLFPIGREALERSSRNADRDAA